jgi:hypothetical protein
MWLLVSSILPLTTTTTANVDTDIQASKHDIQTSKHDIQTSKHVKLSKEKVSYLHCTIDGLFCLPGNYSR